MNKLHQAVLILFSAIIVSAQTTDFSTWKKSGTLSVTQKNGITRLDGGMAGGELSCAFPAQVLAASKFAVLKRTYEQSNWQLLAAKGLDRIEIQPLDKELLLVHFPLSDALIDKDKLTLAIKLFPDAALEIEFFDLRAESTSSEKYVARKFSGPARTFQTPVGEFTIPDNFEDISQPPRNSGLKFTLAEADSGLRSYVVDDIMELHPDLLPTAEEFERTLSFFAAPDQSEGGAFSLYPLLDLDEVRLSGAELQSEAGHTLPAPEIRSIRVWPQRTNFVGLQYRDVPELLEENLPMPLRQHKAQAYYLKYHIPADARPGIYRGTVTAQATGRPALNIPVTLRVIDLQLRRDHQQILGIYYGGPRAFPMLQEYGFNSILQGHQNCMRDILKPLKDLARTEPDLARRLEKLYGGTAEPQLNYAEARPQGLDNFLREYQKYGFRRLVVWFAVPGFTDVIAKFLNLPLSQKNGLRFYPEELTPEYRQLFKDIIGAISRRVQAAGTDIYWYQFDEIGVNSNVFLFNYAVEMFKLVKEAGSKTAVTCGEDEFTDMVNPWLDCRIYAQGTAADNDSLSRILKSTKKDNREFFAYTGCVYERYYANRYNAGFNMFRCGWEGKYFWNLASHRNEPFNDFDHSAKDSMSVYSLGDKYIPTLNLESLRQGLDDFRYIHTLQQLIAEAEKSPLEGVAAVAAATRQELDDIRAALPFHCQPEQWDFRNFKRYRWRIASLASELQARLRGKIRPLQIEFHNREQDAAPPPQRPQLNAPLLPMLPAIDGTLQKGEWDAALHIPELYLASGNKPPVNTQVWLGRSQDTLFVAFRCEEPEPKSMILQQHTRDHLVWRDESVELFFDHQHNRRDYRQIILSALGTEADFDVTNGKTDKGWTCQGLKTACKIYSDYWVAELALPLAEIASTPIIGVNFQRVRQSYMSISAFIPKPHQPEYYADLTLAELPVQIAPEILQPVRLGQNKLQVVNHSGSRETLALQLAEQTSTYQLSGEKLQILPVEINAPGPLSGSITLPGLKSPQPFWGFQYEVPEVLSLSNIPGYLLQEDKTLDFTADLNYYPAANETAQLRLTLQRPGAEPLISTREVAGNAAKLSIDLQTLLANCKYTVIVELLRQGRSYRSEAQFRLLAY
ncbi:MAG: hypothetical protein GX902_05240 [Lentisphaerae bacterium]|nr:hypothetical protein [Lentisphaerota bacterium]